MRRVVATVPLAFAFAMKKSARVSTAARYDGTPMNVLFKASSVCLSQDDPHCLRVKEKVIATVALCQSTNGAEQEIKERKQEHLHSALGVSGGLRYYLRHGDGSAKGGVIVKLGMP
jgi:hypothetical protein